MHSQDSQANARAQRRAPIRLFRHYAALVTAALIFVGCGTTSSPPSQFTNDGGNQTSDIDGSTSSLGDATITVPTDSGSGPKITSGDSSSNQAALEISPSTATLNVKLGIGQSIPTQQFTASIGGQSVTVAWSVTEGQIGLVSGSGLFTPTAGGSTTAIGGTTTLTATAMGEVATAQVTVSIVEVVSGDPSPSDAGVDSSGGYGGVGGNGVGDAATDAQIGLLNGTSIPFTDGGTDGGDAAAYTPATLLYPYDKTVFPRGLLAPLLQWNYGNHQFTAMRLHLKENSYEYFGYFQVQPGVTYYANQPVPQSAWDALTYSNGGEAVTVELVFLDANGVAWGPLTESWLIAQGTLSGTIYYNSYGTNLVKNYTDNGQTFGGATLGIKPGAAGPTLIAGTTSECRVCHTVSANGAALFTQQGLSYSTTSAYILTPDASTETVPAADNGGGLLAWPGLYPDGTLLLSNSGGISGGSTAASALYAGLSDAGPATGTLLSSTGLNGLGAFTPVFSPDGQHAAFNFMSGALTGSSAAADQRSLAVLDFAVVDGGPDATTYAFSNGRVIWTPDSGVGAYYPSYSPTNDSIVVELQTQSNGRDLAGTRATTDSNDTDTLDGAHGELWWVDVATGIATRLDRANGFDTDAGIAYLPPHASFQPNPNDDVEFNYEPTVNPVPSGGYAWMIFTSRRLYGNVATVNPFWSDVRYETQILTDPTPKKLWVAAIDLNPTPGTDPSHPAFYLPGQELMAGNARGYWVVSPCEQNGETCASGDQCCGGYCANVGDAGLSCTAAPPACGTAGDLCSTTTPCCGGGQSLQCISGRCALPAPPAPN